MKQILIVIAFFLMQFSFAQVQTGKASFYADKFEGRQTASGEIYKHNRATAAHRKLSFGTKVRVTNLANNKSVIVKVNDRGPFIRGRIIDLSKSAAQSLGFVGQGVTDVTIEVLGDDASITEASSQQPITTPDEKDTQDTSTTSSPTLVSTTPNTSTTTSSNNAQLQESEFYKLNVNRVQPDFVGVQIGSFQELANLIRLADNLKLSYDQSVTVQVKVFDGIKVYSLILGEFNNRLAAERFKEKIDAKYPDAFIVNLLKNN